MVKKFRLKQVDHDGMFSYSSVVELFNEVPDGILLGDVYPNPFNPRAYVQLDLSEPSFVEVSLYNSMGSLVREIFSGFLEDSRKLTIDGQLLPSGNYFIEAKSAQGVSISRMTLLK